MGLFGALTASVAGLNVQGQAISVISDNLANTNTTGYKAARSLFSQLVTSSGVSGTSYNAGGVGTTTQRSQATQGSLNGTNSRTDLAITGNGYFRVADSRNITTSTTYFYTRAGSFSENKEGFLVNPDGYYLQGWRTDSSGNIANLQDLTNIELQSVGVSAQQTRNVRVGANLNGEIRPQTSLYNTAPGTTFTESLDAILASTSSDNYLTDIRVYDAQGGARDITVAFSKRASNLWDFQVYTDGSNIQGGTTGVETRIQTGTMEFNTNGTLKNVVGNTITVDWAAGVDPSTIQLDFGEFTGGKIVDPANTSVGLAFTEVAGPPHTGGVYGITVEDPAMANGTYTMRINAAPVGGVATLELLDGASNVVGTTTISTTASNREVVFEGTGVKVRLSVSDGFVADRDPGTYPTTLGTFEVESIAPAGEGRGNNGIVQFKSSFNTGFVNQDGFGSGLLSSIQVGQDGFISGTFTNGETKKLYKIALGVFQNQGGLEAVSGNLLRVTDLSGAALIKEPGLSGTGRIVSGALEGSTTDIANEFSQMIVAQRSFQANSTVIQTVDQMLNELLQLR